MHRRLTTLMLGAVGFALAMPAGAAADVTLGTTTQPAGSSAGGCTAQTMAAQEASDAANSDTVPAPGGAITQWQTNTTGDAPNSGATLVILRPSQGAFTVVAVDAELLPNPLPTGGVVTFTPPTPLAVQAGDVLGLYTFGGLGNCAWDGVSDPSDRVDAFQPPTAPAPDATETPLAGAAGYLVDVEATLAPTDVDGGVTTAAGPAGATAGNPALLTSTVTDGGPASAPITFTDQVPAGLTIDSAAAGDGNCSITGQTVTCTISGLSAGQSAPVDVVVTPAAAGSDTNSVSVAVGPGAVDPNPANDHAAATLTVAPVPAPALAPAAPRPHCIVPAMEGLRPHLARTILRDLDCKVKLTVAHSRIRRGAVVRTTPGRGRYTSQATITLVISSGPRTRSRPSHREINTRRISPSAFWRS